LLISIECEGKLETLLQTLDDLLACIQAAERSINYIQQSYKEDNLNDVKQIVGGKLCRQELGREINGG
ncbi:MAG: hypothetical protein DRJ21_01715, partial [Candidatus Methanomethylicota archaeon]